MAQFNIYGDIYGFQGVVNGFNVPILSSSSDLNTYLSREGLFAGYSGSIYYKVSGSLPIKLADSRDLLNYNGNVVSVSNIRLSGSSILLDYTNYSGSSFTISGSLSPLAVDTFVTSVTLNSGSHVLTVFQNNSSSFGVDFTPSYTTYLGSRTSSTIDFNESGSFYATRSTINSWFNNKVLSSSFIIGSQPSGSTLLVNHEQVKSYVDNKVDVFTASPDMPYRFISGSYTITKNDYTVVVNAISGSVTVSLPDASTVDGRVFNVVKNDSSVNQVIIQASGSQLIAGLNIQQTDTPYNNFQFQSIGIGYVIL